MRRNALITLTVLALVVVALYAAHAMDLVGLIIRGHVGSGAHP